MTGADSVEVELLHQLDVSDHRLLGEVLTAPVVMVVPVNAFHQNWLTVDKQLFVFYFNLAEADFTASDFNCLEFNIFEGQNPVSYTHLTLPTSDLV